MQLALKILKWLGILVGGVITLAGLVVLFFVLTVDFPGEVETSAGVPRQQSYYITMRDGVRIAVDLWMPLEFQTGDKLPTLIKPTRYWRGWGWRFGTRVMVGLGVTAPEMLSGPDIDAFNDEGYAVVRVDARGSGASEGHREIVWDADEVADYGEVIDWIIGQDWSNGRVGAFGASYEGNASEFMILTNHPALKAVAPLYSNFDPQFYLVTTGGIKSNNFIAGWHGMTGALDSNTLCAGLQQCMMVSPFLSGVNPVEGQEDVLDQAVATRNNWNVMETLGALEYRDDRLGALDKSFFDYSPFAHREEIERTGVAYNVRVSWIDAGTVDGALSRYRDFSNHQTLVIGPWSHGGVHHVDPFLPADTPTEPTMRGQFLKIASFFDPILKGDGLGEESSVTYYTLGAGTWKTTPVWPPANTARKSFYFQADQSLAAEPPQNEAAEVSYTVATDTSSGNQTRWHTSLGGPDVIYPDQRQTDTKRLAFTSEAFSEDTEITGNVVVNLFVKSDATDGNFFAYLEDVAPDGRVTYITEGALRAIHRKVSSDPLYSTEGPFHSYLKSDAMPLVPGEVTELSFEMLATSVLIKPGHRLRVAFAGADTSMNFAQYPADGSAPNWLVQINSVYPSHINLPIIPANSPPAE